MKLIIIILGSLLLFCLFLYFDKRSRGRGKKLVGTLKMFREIKFNSKLATRIIGGVFVICLLVYWAPSIGHWFEASAQKSSDEAHALAVKDYGPAPCIPQYQTIPDSLQIVSLTTDIKKLNPGVAYLYFRSEELIGGKKSFFIDATEIGSKAELSFHSTVNGNSEWNLIVAYGKDAEKVYTTRAEKDSPCRYYITVNKPLVVSVTGTVPWSDAHSKSLRSLH